MPVFLFTDIEGSTEKWSKFPQAMEAALVRHNAIVEAAIVRCGGKVVKNTGDGYFAVFEGGEPLACAIEIQRLLAQQDWGEIGELRARMALHTGEARQREGDYFGLEVSRTARLLAAGWGGQILLTCEMARSATLPPDAALYDLGNHLLKDLNEPQHIYQLLHPALPSGFPPLRTLSAHPHNLPPQPTPFIGREEELAQIAARLADPACRLLTLVGPGGIGKTRLALQAAAEQLEAFAQGAYFVPLAPLTSGELIISAIADALHLFFYQHEPPQRQLFTYLREKQLLLILDNFEHVMDGASLVAELLAHAPGVKILATSRERLNVQNEWIFTVDGMQYPTKTSDPDIEVYPAVQLFLQNAQRTAPMFAFDADTRACIARICAQVHGMPLAIELAASWLRMLSCQEIVVELENSLDLLSSQMRDRPERHRSLRAVFEYSWQLLTAEEKTALQILSVFQGNFRREAAFAVLRAPDARTSALEMLALLTALVDKSMLQRRTNGAYTMQALLHQYALEKLHADPTLEAQVRQRHCAYYADFVQRQHADLEGAQQTAALDAIADVLDDVRAAWQWAARQKCTACLEQAMHSLTFFFSLRGHPLEGLALFEEALAALEPLSTPEAESTRGWLLARAASLATASNKLEQAKALAEAALALNQKLGIAAAVAAAHMQLGRVAWTRGEYPLAVEHYRQALEFHTTTDNPNGQARALDYLGTVAWALGNYTEAQSYFERSLALFRQTGNLYSIAQVFDHLGVVARDTGDIGTAQACFRQSYEIFKSLDAQMNLAFAANHLAGVLGNLAEAEPYFAQCIAIGKEYGDQRIVGYTLNDWASFLMQAGDTARAQPMFEESLAIFEALGEKFGVTLEHINLGHLALDNGQLETARQHLDSGIQTAVAVENMRMVAMALNGWAKYLFATAQYTAATKVLGFTQTLPSDSSEGRSDIATLLAEIRPHLPPADFEAALAWGRRAELADIMRECVENVENCQTFGGVWSDRSIQKHKKE